jgi:Flp pilus assembly protein TadG
MITNSSRTSRRRRAQLGQSLVEFALVVPLFLLIAMATVDFGWALRSWISATNAAREGARLGVTGASESAIEARVVDSAPDLLDSSDVSVTNAQGQTGEDLTVTVQFDHHYITPLGGLIAFVTGGALPDPLPISTSTTMRIE